MSATTDRRKGYSLLVSALRTIECDRIESGIELIIFGSDKPVSGVTATIPIHNVGMIKDTDELVSLYNLADLTVVPSLEENLSCVIMESLSCGTPVVAFDIGGNADMVEHKVNGYLAREKDCHDLAEGIAWTLSQDKEKLSEASRRKVLEHFTPDIIGEQYKDLYYRIVNIENN